MKFTITNISFQSFYYKFIYTSGGTINIEQNDYINKTSDLLHNNSNYVDGLQFKARLAGFYNVHITAKINDISDTADLTLYLNNNPMVHLYFMKDESNRRVYTYSSIMCLAQNELISFKNSLNNNYSLIYLNMGFSLISIV